jgi:hypothetical protein
MIPIVLECINEAPEDISIEITCDNSTLIYNQTYPVEYANHPMNISENISVELTQHYQRCSLSIVFSNRAGHSEPFILEIDIPEVGESLMISLLLVSLLLIVVLIAVIIVIFYFIKRKKVTCDKSNCSSKAKNVSTSAPQEEDFDENKQSEMPKMTSFTTPSTLSNGNDSGGNEEIVNLEVASIGTEITIQSRQTQKKKSLFGRLFRTKKATNERELPHDSTLVLNAINSSNNTTEYSNKGGTQSIGAVSDFESGASIPYKDGDSQEPLMLNSNEVRRYT